MTGPKNATKAEYDPASTLDIIEKSDDFVAIYIQSVSLNIVGYICVHELF